MKKKNTLIKIVAVFTAFAIGASLLSNHFVKYKELDATQYIGDYDPYTYSGSYYNGFDFDATGGMNGALRTALTAKIKPKAFYSYSAGLSTQLQKADQDPTNDSNMVTFYTRNSITKTAGTVNSKVIWTREHVWPQSLSNGNWGESEGGTDLLHLRPEYQSPNSTRGNHPFGETTNASSAAKTYNGMTYGWVSGGYFEPLDCVKGDVARIIMYTWVAYTGWTGYSPLNILGVFESYDTLLRWHTMDKPDALEGERNDYVQLTSNQKNRNPFVDHPELAWRIFGDNASTSVKNACMEAYPQTGYTPDPSGGDDPEQPTITSYTLDGTVTGGNNGYGEASTITQNDISWSVYGNTTINPWRIGGKSLSAEDRTISSNTTIPCNADRIDIEFGNTSGSITVNSVKATINNSNNQLVKEFTGNYTANGSLTFTKTDNTSWNNCYYIITFNVTVSGTANKYVEFKSLTIRQTTDPTDVLIYPNNASILRGDTVNLVPSFTPSHAFADLTWKTSNASIATVTNGLVRGINEGSATITAFIDADNDGVVDNNELKDQCVVSVSIPDALDDVVNLDYTGLTGTGSGITDDDAMALIGCNNEHVIAVEAAAIYDGNGTGGAFPDTAGFIKTGTGSLAGQIVLVLDGLANRVDIVCHDFYKKSEENPTNSNTLAVNSSTAQLAPYNEEGQFETLVFELENLSNVITIDANKRVFIKSIRISYVDPNVNPTIDNYLNYASTAVILNATENPVSEVVTESIKFSELGLTSGDQYLDPFKPTTNSPVSVTFDGGDNDGKYYTTGSGIRTYGNGTITVASTSDKITKIVFIWSGSYKPESASVASIGTYAVDTGTWTGSAKSITLTRPDGSGHWRLQSVAITYGGEISLSGVSLQFGAKIAKVDWDEIETEWGIQDYGVMLFRTTLDYFDEVPTVESYYRAGNAVAVFNRGSDTAPTNEDGYYTFTARINITSPNNYNMVFCAASFIMTDDGEYHFFCETKKTVNMVASEYIDSGNSELSSAALNILAGIN